VKMCAALALHKLRAYGAKRGRFSIIYLSVSFDAIVSVRKTLLAQHRMLTLNM
jgi:hypothetical protein